MEQIVRMWNGGPLRYFSTTQFSASIPSRHEGIKGYAGAYVCDNCSNKVPGVYKSKEDLWLCGTCKALPKKELKLAGLRAHTLVADASMSSGHGLLKIRIINQ